MIGRCVRRIALAVAVQGSLSTMLMAQNAQSGYVITSDSARLYYRVMGHGPDTIIAIHGGPGMDHESIVGDFTPLTARYTVIFYDQRGGGKSTLPADTTTLFAARQVQDLDELRRHFGIERATLVAHSYGPLLAASYAIAHPDHVQRMVFFGPVPPRRGDFWQRFGKSVNARLDSAQRATMAAAGRRMLDPSLSDAEARKACRDYWKIGVRPRLADPDKTSSLLKSDFCASDVAGIRYGNRVGNRVIMNSYGDWDLRDKLRTLRVPTLIVHGEDESIPMDLVREWVTSLPNARLLVVPHAAHFTYAERPELVWPAVERFLAGEQT
jgi:proline iminopeptidase